MAELARLERAQLPLEARDGGGLGRERRKCLVSRQTVGDQGAKLRREAVQPLKTLGGEGKRDSRPRQGGRRGHLFLPLVAAMGQ